MLLFLLNGPGTRKADALNGSHALPATPDQEIPEREIESIESVNFKGLITT
jgi:hypothetical protein